MTPARKADLCRLIQRQPDLEALERLRAVVWHELDAELQAQLARRVIELKETA